MTSSRPLRGCAPKISPSQHHFWEKRTKKRQTTSSRRLPPRCSKRVLPPGGGKRSSLGQNLAVALFPHPHPVPKRAKILGKRPKTGRCRVSLLHGFSRCLCLRLSRYLSPFSLFLRRRPQESAALADRLIQVASPKMALFAPFPLRFNPFLPASLLPSLRLARSGRFACFSGGSRAPSPLWKGGGRRSGGVWGGQIWGLGPVWGLDIKRGAVWRCLGFGVKS